jgi:hypothetical protein
MIARLIPKKLYSFFNNNNCSWDTAEGNFQLRKWKMKGEEVLYEPGRLGIAQFIQWKEKSGSVVSCLL